MLVLMSKSDYKFKQTIEDLLSSSHEDRDESWYDEKDIEKEDIKSLLEEGIWGKYE